MKSAATPSESNVRVLAAIGTTGDDALQIFFGLLGMHVTWVTGYANDSQLETGFIRGDGPLASDAFSNFEGVLQAKTAIPLAISVKTPPGMALRGLIVTTPTFASLPKKYAPTTPTTTWNEAVVSLNSLDELGQVLVTQSKAAA